MPRLIEVHKDNFTISTDPSRLDRDAIVDFLTRAYWAEGRPRERTERALGNSLVFGLYDGERQIGLARVVRRVLQKVILLVILRQRSDRRIS